ncbi:MAG: hypothetical protein Tp1111DCM1126091_29 [Prokaryotic dsDNA virus sp.]|nr:MAG: hypothetical protein Tp1111DCM1126091_29 [Prokaryotic dsDNA virus sp.]
MSSMNIEKFKRIHDRLDDGETLVASHGIYGTYRFHMNGGRNRIFHKPIDELAEKHYGYDGNKITEDKFNSMLLWNCFDIYTDDGESTCECCGGTGKVHNEGILIEGRYD